MGSFEQRSKLANFLRAKLLFGRLCEGELVDAVGRRLFGVTGLRGPGRNRRIHMGTEGLG